MSQLQRIYKRDKRICLSLRLRLALNERAAGGNVSDTISIAQHNALSSPAASARTSTSRYAPLHVKSLCECVLLALFWRVSQARRRTVGKEAVCMRTRHYDGHAGPVTAAVRDSQRCCIDKAICRAIPGLTAAVFVGSGGTWRRSLSCSCSVYFLRAFAEK